VVQTLFREEAFVGHEGALMRAIGMTILLIGWLYVFGGRSGARQIVAASVIEPVAPELERIAALEDKKEFAEVVAHLHLLGTKPLFSFSSAQDYTDATMMIAQADQDGFALPDRDYYLTDEFKGERAAYLAQLARMFGLLGDGAKKAEAEADAVMRVETALAKAAMGRKTSITR